MWYLESWLTSPLPYLNFKYSKMTYRHAWLFIHYFIRLRELHLFRTFSENSRYIIAFKVQRSDKNCCEFKNICCPRISISPLPRWVLLIIIAERMLIIISLNESEELHGQNSSKIDISSLFIVKKKNNAERRNEARWGPVTDPCWIKQVRCPYPTAFSDKYFYV